jgi:uncharacterized integral membrane protein
MRYLKSAFLALLAILLATLALANRAPVEIRLLPDELATLFGFNASAALPLFLIILAGLIAGILVGFVWEWFREHKHRAEATAQRREKARLEREVERLREKEPRTEKDEVLALLEAGPAR